MTRVLTVAGLDVFYGQFQALHGVSLEVDQGETVAIIGANGAGKTTLLRAVAGALAPRRGTIAFRGEPVAAGRAYAVNRRGRAIRCLVRATALRGPGGASSGAIVQMEEAPPE